MPAALHTMHCDKVLEISEEVLKEGGARILRLQLTDITIQIKIKDVITTLFTSNIEVPQGNSYSGPQFKLYFQNSLMKIRREAGITHQKYVSEEMIYIDDYDNLTKDLEKESKLIEKVGDLLTEDNLMMSDWKTEDIIHKRFKHMKDSQNKPCKTAIKLGLKLEDKEDIV